MCRSVRYPNEIPSQIIMLPLRNVWCSVMFSVRLHEDSFLEILKLISSGFRANLELSVNIMLLQLGTVKFTYWWHHFNRVRLDWTDKEAQTCDTRAYRAFKCRLRRTTVVDIVLLMAAATIDVKLVEIDLRILLPTNSNISIFGGDCNPWTTGYKSSDNCFSGMELFF